MGDNKKTFPDDMLVTMFRGGDNHAFEVLLDRYADNIRNLVRKSTAGNSETSDDLYQEVVVHLCEKLRNICSLADVCSGKFFVQCIS